MTLHVKKAGTIEEMDEVHIKVSGTWESMDEGHVKKSGTWEQFFSAFSASVAPPTISETTFTTGLYVTTATATVTIVGSGTYTVLWSRNSGSTEITATSPTSITTTFRATLGTSDNFTTGFKCVVKEGAVTLATILLPSVTLEHVI